jgi:hypothetical protein
MTGCCRRAYPDSPDYPVISAVVRSVRPDHPGMGLSVAGPEDK